MNCQRFQEEVIEMLHGANSGASREELDEHLAQCTGCRAYYEAQHRLAGHISERFHQAAKHVAVNPEYRQRILAALEQAGSRHGESAHPKARTSAIALSPLKIWERLLSRPALRWSAAALGLLMLLILAGTRRFGPQPALAAEFPVTIYARVPQLVTTYSFRRQGGFVIDALVTRPEIVQEHSVVVRRSNQ